MSASLLDFFKTNPFWAVFIIIFMILPIVGAVIHILLKAFGRRGLDNTISLPEESAEESPDDKADGTPPKDSENEPSDFETKP